MTPDESSARIDHAWQASADEQLREFVALTPDEKFRLLTQSLDLFWSLEAGREPNAASAGDIPATSPTTTPQ